MIRYLIKNNFKLMFRNKWVIAAMVFGPIFVIATLSSAFQDLMKSYDGVEAFRTGFRIETGSIWEKSIETMKEAGKEAGIVFVEYPEGEPKELIEKNDLAGFVILSKEAYTVYESADYAVEGMTLEYFMDRCVKEGETQALQMIIPDMEQEKIQFPVEKLDFMPSVDSKDYYGIIEIVYFTWMSIICASGVLTGEKKNGIERKFQVTPISNAKLYFSKWISIVLVMVIEIGIAILVTSFLFGIHWGNPLLSALVLLLLIMASAAFGLMLYYLCHNLAVTVVVLFTSVWFMGFFGGSFETYMFSSTPDAIKNASPIYHVNRALVEYSCMGHSTYTNSCIVYMSVIIIICSGIAILADTLRKRGRA